MNVLVAVLFLFAADEQKPIPINQVFAAKIQLDEAKKALVREANPIRRDEAQKALAEKEKEMFGKKVSGIVRVVIMNGNLKDGFDLTVYPQDPKLFTPVHVFILPKTDKRLKESTTDASDPILKSITPQKTFLQVEGILFSDRGWAVKDVKLAPATGQLPPVLLERKKK